MTLITALAAAAVAVAIGTSTSDGTSTDAQPPIYGTSGVPEDVQATPDGAAPIWHGVDG